MALQYEIVGQGPPMALMPGGLTGWLSWMPHAEMLRATRTVVRLQLLNVQFGLEDRALPDGYGVRTESEALAESLSSTGLDRPIDLVAWSYGALVTLDFALNHPDRVRTLTLIEPPAFWVLRKADKLDATAEAEARELQTFHGDISEAMLERFLRIASLVPPGQSPRELPQWPQWVKHRRSLRNSPAVIAHDDDLHRVGGFDRPVLLVKGTGSARFLHEILDELAARLPNARTIELPAGHAPQLVSMDAFLAELERFHKAA